MVHKDLHLDQVRRNKELLQGALNPETTTHTDWSVTIIFYTALHLLEAYYATLEPPKHSPDHVTRIDWLKGDPALKKIYRFYRELEEQSRAARYKCTQFRGDFVKSNYLPMLEQIETIIKPLLK